MARSTTPGRRVNPNTKQNLTQALDNLTDAQIRCRDYGHAWESWSVREENATFTETIRCARCQATRKRVINRRGAQIATPKYDYGQSPGYQLPPGFGRLTGVDRDAVRLNNLTRVLAAQLAREHVNGSVPVSVEVSD